VSGSSRVGGYANELRCLRIDRSVVGIGIHVTRGARSIRHSSNALLPIRVEVRAIEIAAYTISILAVDYCQRHAGLERGYARYLPASGDSTQESVLIPHERHVIDVGE